MLLLRLCRNIFFRLLVALVIISSLVAPPAFCQETEDSQIFIAGFNAYQQKDYAASIEKMSEVLQKHPDSPLRDMALFWLSRSYYKSGNQQEAARYLSQFSKEYPDNPLKSTVEDEFLALVSRYEKGEKLSTGSAQVKQTDRLAAMKAKTEKDRIAAGKAEEAKRAAAAAESARIAALKQVEENAAAEQKEVARAAAAKAEQMRITAARAAEEKQVAAAAAAAAESARLLAIKQAEEKAAAVKKELDRVAAAKAEQERIALETAAREKSEQQRISAIKSEEVRKAAELAEQQRIAAAKAAEEKQVAAAAESVRILAIKQAEEKAAAVKKELDRVAAVKAEQERIALETAAREKSEQQRISAIKSEEARKAAELAEQQRIAAARAAEEKQVAAAAAAAAESARALAIKQAEEKAAAVKKELDRVAAVKAEQERIALETATREKSEQQRISAIKSEEVRKAAELAEQQRIELVRAEEAKQAAARAEEALRAEAVAETARIAASKTETELAAQAKAERERVTQAEAELARMNALNIANERRAAAEKAEREQLASIKSEEAKLAVAAAESARLAALKAEEERKTAERAARETENRRLEDLKAEESRLAQLKLSEEKAKSAKLEYREKAIGQYKAIIDKFPTSTAAATAAAKLRELGVAVALPTKAVEPPLTENAQILRLEVAQFAGFEFNLMARPDAFTVGNTISVPFEIINRGNGKDSFYLESAFPADFKARFASAATPGAAISQTPDLAPGETFKGFIDLVIPPGSIDGLRITYPVKAASRLITEASQSREVHLVASAPLLRAVVRTEKSKLLPGDKLVYRVAILNVGSTVAQDVTFRLNFPPQLDPVDYTATGFRQEMKSALVFDGLRINSGESREFTVAFQLKDDSLAGQELLTRAELINNPLKTTTAFVSNMAYVEAQRNISVRTGSERLIAIPGQTISVPFVITNTGNIKEKFKISSSVTGAQSAVVFNDLNRDGTRQASEPIISEIGPLAPREEASVLMEIKTPNSAADGSQGTVQVSFMSEGDTARSASVSTQLAYSRPVLKMVMTGRDTRLKPGDVTSFDLMITNNGSNLARVVELQSAWPEQLDLVSADPATSAVSSGNNIWRFKEMGAGEKRSIKVSFRVRPGTGVGTAIQVKSILTYEDQLGNRY